VDREQHEEWLAFRQAAEHVLRDAVIPPSCRVRLVVQFLELPAFTICRSYELYHETPRRRAPRYQAVEITWRLDEDIERFRTPVERLRHPRDLRPTIERRDGVLSSDDVSALLDELRSLRLPIVPGKPAFGVDGVRYELRLGDHYAVTRLQWWVEPPVGWEILPSLGERVRKLIRRAVDAAP